MKKSLLLLSFGLLLSHHAFAESGTVLICASEDNEIKMTADLSDEKGHKVAIAMLEGIPKTFSEGSVKKAKHSFLLNSNKNTPLVVTSTKSKQAEIIVSTDPENNKSQVMHDVTEPSTLKITKYTATLTVPALKLSNEAVTCTENKWHN